jgi:tetratricopeptide (TPR) repeat protein
MLVASGLFAQDLDSLVRFPDLSFNTVFEEMIFANLENQKEVSLLDLYLAIDVSSESEAGRCKAKFNALLNDFKKEDIQNKKEKKQVKQIYEETHASLMRHYEEGAYFPDLFKEGSFNCVTGSIVYSLIFSEFSIPYSIQKGMNHVMLVAYPETHTMVVESTDSEKGLVALGKNDKEDFVGGLSRGKLVTQDEILQNNITSLFLQYAFEESQIDNYELASFQYSNRGLLLLEEMEYEKAFSDFEKAFYLKPRKELAAMLLQTGGLVLHMTDYKSLSHVELLVKLSRFQKYGITDEVVIAEFSRITEKVFHDRNDHEKYENAFVLLSENLESKELVQKISLLYYGEVIDAMIEDGNIRGTMTYLDDLYALDPEDSRIQILIRDILISNLNNALLSPPEQLAFLDQHRDQFPLVYELSLMNLIDLSMLVKTAEYWYDRENPLKGKEHLDLFESRISEDSEIHRIAIEIQSAYETAAFYYYNQGNVRKTKEYLDRGLNVLPTSYNLRRLKESI